MSDAFASLEPSLEAASRLLAGLSASQGSLFDDIFGVGAFAHYQSTAYALAADPLDAIGLTVLGGDVMGHAAAAFASAGLDGDPEIFLNQSWLQSASADAITGVLVEEYGHAIDWMINGDQDTTGDEGWRFASALLGPQFVRPAALLDDNGSIRLHGKEISVEFAITTSFAGWTQTLNGGSISLTNSDQTLQITGKDSGGGGATTTIAYPGTLPAEGFIQFDWTTTNTDPDSDLFQYQLNGQATVLAASSGSGSVLRPFYSQPSGLSFEVLSDGGPDGTHSVTITDFSIVPLTDTYHVQFDSIFSASKGPSNTRWTPTARLDSVYPGKIYVFPDNPAADSDFSTNFVNNGSTKTVWVLAEPLGDTPVQMYLTNGENRIGSGGSVEDIWILNTAADGSGTGYMLTSGGLALPALNVEQNINASVDLASLDNLHTTQNDSGSPTISISNSTVRGSKSSVLSAGRTATVTFDLSEASSNFTQEDVQVLGGTLSNWQQVSGTRYIATFTPAANSSANGEISVASGAFSDDAGNVNADGSDTDNQTTILVNTVAPPTAVIRPASTAVAAGSISTALINLSEASSTFSVSDISSNVAIRRFRRISDVLYEVTYVAPRSGDIRLAVTAGSFSTLAGASSISHPDGLDSVQISVLAPNQYGPEPVAITRRGLTNIVVGRASASSRFIPVPPPRRRPTPVGRATGVGIWNSRR